MSKKAFKYQDGGEKDLLSIVKSSSFSELNTWQEHTSSWSLYYHLSPLRKNLFSWLPTEQLEGASILELGAGCGATTSYFSGVDQVKKVVAVEGSEDRAEIIRKRCKGRDRLEVVCSNIMDYKSEEKFDIVTLIGVLEYSGKYVDSPTPYDALIDHASTFLKEDGVLVLAIENQLGHKYLAGLKEDHYGTRYEGISNYPNYVGVRTFDRASLMEMMGHAGLKHQQWYYPFPDYKMPKVLLSDNAIQNKDFDWVTLIEGPTEDPSFGDAPLFDEKQFLKSVSRNGDPAVFMNSFMIFASKAEPFMDLSSILAAKVNSLRAQRYQQTKLFRISNTGDLSVETRSSSNEVLSEQQYYTHYQSLGDQFIEAARQSEAEKFLSFFKLWLDTLSDYSVRVTQEEKDEFYRFSKQCLATPIYSNSVDWVKPEALDLIPQNILFSGEKTEVIDLEWKVTQGPIPRELVIDRGMFALMNQLNRIHSRVILRNDLNWNLSPSILELMKGMPITPDLESFFLFEKWFQNHVVGLDRSITPSEYLDIKKLIKSFQFEGTRLKKLLRGLYKIGRKLRGRA